MKRLLNWAPATLKSAQAGVLQFSASHVKNRVSMFAAPAYPLPEQKSIGAQVETIFAGSRILRHQCVAPPEEDHARNVLIFMARQEHKSLASLYVSWHSSLKYFQGWAGAP